MTNKKLWIRAVAVLCLLGLSKVVSADVLLDSGLAGSWVFHDGGEFPGAKGSFERERPSGYALHYDFSGGGSYVMADRRAKYPEGIKVFIVEVIAEQDCSVGWRITDATGRIHQGHPATLKGGEKTDLRIDVTGQWWAGAWGGKDGGFREPATGFGLMVNNSAHSKTGTVHILRLSAETAEEAPPALESGRKADFEIGGWRVEGDWIEEWGALILDGRATRADGRSGLLTVSLPMLGRDWVTRIQLDGERDELPLRLAVHTVANPRAIYRFSWNLETDQHSVTAQTELHGRLADPLLLGAPRSSRDIKRHKLGTAVHFNFGLNGAFHIWKDYEGLLELISSAGLKWIRDGVSMEKGADGNYRLREWDMKWVRAARERGIDIVCSVGMDAKTPLEDFVERTVATVEATDGLIHVFELGNEPNNFGGWIPTYGGTWNGKEADGSTSKWVREHARYTSAAAEAVRAKYPDVEIIGLGAPTCVNFRELELNVSPALSGVVDHPYAYSQPAEKVPWAWGTEERDGIRVGDKEGNFVGLIRSYEEKFRETGVPRTIWITEDGWTCFRHNESNVNGLFAGYTEEAQALYLTRRALLTLALPVVKVYCQYDFIDDYGGGDAYHGESHFGLVRGDRSPKPSYLALQRLNSLLGDHEPDAECKVAVKSAPLHWSMKSGTPANTTVDGVSAYAFRNPDQPGHRSLAVWSNRPADNEFNNRAVTIELTGWTVFSETPVAVNIITGEIMGDVRLNKEGEALILDGLELETDPLLIRFFEKEEKIVSGREDRGRTRKIAR